MKANLRKQTNTKIILTAIIHSIKRFLLYLNLSLLSVDIRFFIVSFTLIVP
jgi:hypothetical protein